MIKKERDELIDAFAERMKARCDEYEYKGSWRGDGISQHFLMSELLHNAAEFIQCDGDIDCLPDIANFAMMIWDKETLCPL